MTTEVHQDDIGTVFEITLLDDTTPVDLVFATEMKIAFQKPDGTTLLVDAALVTDGTDGKMQYTTIAGDIDQEGNWKYQAKVSFPTGVWHSDIVSFRVYANLFA